MKRWLIAFLGIISFSVNAQTVTLDYYFNHEVHKTPSSVVERFHYLWNDQQNTGFSILGQAFLNSGAKKLDTLGVAPTTQNLRATDIYIIVDPDTKKENPNPNYISDEDARQIAGWVKKGGVLLMLANDSANVELPHFNILAAKFGMHFNDDLQNHVIDDAHFADGAIDPTENPAFKTSKKIYIKDACSISLRGPAKPFLKNSSGAVIMAIAKYGRGTVLAVGDPWLYNEYTNGRLPAGYQNDKAANDLTAWLLAQIPAKK